MLRINATTGVIDMPPTLDQWSENINFEDNNANPYFLVVRITDSAMPAVACNITVQIVVVNKVVSPPAFAGS